MFFVCLYWRSIGDRVSFLNRKTTSRKKICPFMIYFDPSSVCVFFFSLVRSYVRCLCSMLLLHIASYCSFIYPNNPNIFAFRINCRWSQTIDFRPALCFLWNLDHGIHLSPSISAEKRKKTEAMEKKTGPEQFFIYY